MHNYSYAEFIEIGIVIIVFSTNSLPLINMYNIFASQMEIGGEYSMSVAGANMFIEDYAR